MAIQTVAMRNALATAYGTTAAYGAAFTTAGPYTSAGTEPTGGSPAYARIAPGWGAAASSAVTGSGSAFNIPASTTIQGYGVFSALTSGTYYDGVAITSQTFASQGVYTVTPTYTQI